MTATLPTLRSFVICPTVQAKLCQLAFDAFTSRPGEGESIGGVLLGKSGPAGLEVTDFRQGVENRADVVGYWSIRRRLSHTLDGTGVLMVVAPVSVQRADALVWQRDAAGKDTEWRRMTFQMERPASKREDRLTEMKPVQVSAEYLPRWWSLAAACVVLAAMAVWMIRAQAEPPAPGVVLELEGGKDDLRIRWRESGTGRLESAALMVRQGREEKTVDLAGEFKPEGGLTVPLKSHEVIVSLRVLRHGQRAVVRTVTYLDPGRVKGTRGEGEVEWLRFRNRELEGMVATMQALF